MHLLIFCAACHDRKLRKRKLNRAALWSVARGLRAVRTSVKMGLSLADLCFGLLACGRRHGSHNLTPGFSLFFSFCLLAKRFFPAELPQLAVPSGSCDLPTRDALRPTELEQLAVPSVSFEVCGGPPMV